ncbi:MAG: hypothetical protein WC408_00265, partial [Candidatus Micrarchaeia archaeon]
MKKGLLSFAVAIFAALVILYYAASVSSISGYQLVGQKNLEMQVLSQKYSDAVAYYDNTAIDAIIDAAYDSSYSGTCKNTANTFETAFSSRAAAYIPLATTSLRTAFGNSAEISDEFSPTGVSVDESGAAIPIIPRCTGTEISMHPITATVSFPFNVTSSSKDTGAVGKAFTKAYDVFVA